MHIACLFTRFIHFDHFITLSFRLFGRFRSYILFIHTHPPWYSEVIFRIFFLPNYKNKLNINDFL